MSICSPVRWNTRERYYSTLREICETRQSDLLPEAVEWVARHAQVEHTNSRIPTAADESQSVALDYVSACLLSAWDAASDGEQSKRTLDNVRHMAQELFKLKLSGIFGDAVRYDERQHDLKLVTEHTPEKVKVVRPAIVWSDGVRSRIIVSALVEPLT